MSEIRNVTLASKSTFTATVQKVGGRVTSTDPITVKNQIQEIRSLNDIPGVNTAQLADGATLVYNSNTSEYDVKLLNQVPLLANNATFAYGKRESDLSVNFATYSGDANFAYTANLASYAVVANSALFAFGKRESDLSVNFSTYSGDANFAYTANQASYATLANNATFAYGKREGDLSVNFATYSGDANFAFTANSATYAYGKSEVSLNVNSAVYAQYALNVVLANTSVVPGTYGNSSSIPVVTVDQYGRINAVSTSAVAGVTSYNYSSSNNTFTIATGDGSVFNATVDTVRDFTITGNLVVSGTTTSVNTQNLIVKDPVIRLNDGQVTPLNDIGLILQRYANANAMNYNVAVAWDEVYKEFKIGKAPEDGSDTEISYSEEWLRIDEDGNLYMLLNIEAGNYIKAGSYMIINNVSFNETSYPGQANSATYFNGIIDCGEY